MSGEISKIVSGSYSVTLLVSGLPYSGAQISNDIVAKVHPNEAFRFSPAQHDATIVIYIITNLYANNKLLGRPPQYDPAPCELTFDLLTLKVVSESHVTWATSVPILIFLGLSVLDLGPMYAAPCGLRD